MKKKYILIALLLCLALSLFAVQTKAQTEYGSVFGRVTDAITGSGISGATVECFDLSWTKLSSTITDENGYYIISNLAPGSYYVSASKPDTHITTQTWHVTVYAGQITVQDFTLSPKLFTISASPSSRTIIPGESTTYTITMTSLYGYSYPFYLYASIEPLPDEMYLLFDPMEISPTGSSTLTIFTTPATPTGTYTITIIARVIDGEVYYTTVTLTIYGAPPTLPDLTVPDIEPIQVVFDPDINNDGKTDMVLGKDMVIRTSVNIENIGLLSDSQQVEIQLTYDGVLLTEARTVGQLKTNNIVDFYLYPNSGGDKKIIAKIDPNNEIAESNEDNNENSKTITVKDTSSLYLTYLPVYAHMLSPGGSDPPLGYGPLSMDEYAEGVENSGKFMLATYPISINEFKNIKRDERYYGSPVPFLGMLDDAISLYIWGKLLEPSTDRVVGIVPEDYFEFHKMAGVIGKAFPGVSGVLVHVDYWTTVAHEIGHLYGLPTGIHLPLCIPGEEYDATVGREANGFWVEGHKTIENSLCFMGAALYDHFPKYETNYFGAWIDNECYSHLFREFRYDKTDPQILLVNGLIFKNGTVQLGKWYWLEEGSISYVYPGDYSIQIVDFNGNIIGETLFAAPFAAYADPIGVIETDVTGFAFAIQYPDTTSKIQIQYNGETIIKLNPNAKILHDAIDSIPDYGFINNPEQRKNALHHKIDAIEKMLEKGEVKPAIEKLQNDIRDKLVKWLVDYEAENPLQLTKNQVITLVDEIIYRLSLQLPKEK